MVFWSESESHSVMSNSLRPHGLYSPWNSLGQNTGLGSLSHLQGIFPTQVSNPGLPHCSWILYQLSHQGSPRILEWVGSLSLLQQIFPTQESKPGFLHCRQILYQLSYQGSPKDMLPWPGIEPGLRQWDHQILTTRPPGYFLEWRYLHFKTTDTIKLKWVK